MQRVKRQTQVLCLSREHLSSADVKSPGGGSDAPLHDRPQRSSRAVKSQFCYFNHLNVKVVFFSPETDTDSNETLKLISSNNLLIWLQFVFVIPLLNDNKPMHFYTSAGKHNQWMVKSYNFFF